MKKWFRYSFILLALLLTLCVILPASAVGAETPPTAVSSTPFETHQGETFTTTIYIPDGANIVDFELTLTYDTDLVTLVSAVENDDIKGSVVFNTEVPGIISVNYTRTSKNVTTYLPLVDLTFTVDDTVGVGIYDCLKVDMTKRYVAHRLNASGTLSVVDFSCDFAKLIIYEIGDVDLSCSVDIGDATCIRRHLAELEGAALSDFKCSLADTFADGVIDIADAICLQRHLAGLNVTYGNRVNVIFYDENGEQYAAKSVYFGATLTKIPTVPEKESYSGGVWSLSPTSYIAPDYSELQHDMSVYAYYDTASYESEAVAYYKAYLTDMYYSGDMPTGLSNNQNLVSSIAYQQGYNAAIIWSSDCNYVLNSTTGAFNKPTYPQDVKLTARIISYDADNRIEAEDRITFDYAVPGMFITPTKAEIEDFLNFYFTDDTDDTFRVNYDVKLISKLNNVVLPVEGAMYDNFEIRLDWYQNVNGSLVPLNQIKRTTTTQYNDYVAIATFNGKPIDDAGGDGKLYFDHVEVTAIDQLEIKNYIINQIAAVQGTLATDGRSLWNNDTVYGTTVTWESGNADIAYVSNNVIQLKDDAISGATLPLYARVSYLANGEPTEFTLSYNLTVSCDNTIIKAPENMDPGLYKAIKMVLEDTMGYRGDLTSAALASVKFVNLDLSSYNKMAKEYEQLRGEHPEQYPDDLYPEILSFRGLSYCTNLRTLNISGIHITDDSMNQIATLSYLEAFIARDCDLDNLADGGTPTLRNAVNLKLLDLTNNHFTSLDSVFAADKRYGSLREVYLAGNQLTDISALSRAPMMTYLSLADNGLTTAGIQAVANYPYLTYLSLADNQIDNIECLKNLQFLKELRLQNNRLTNVNDLRRLVNLELLYLEGNSILDVGFLNTLTELKVLYVNNNKISDISALTSLTKLEAINISNNNLTSLSVLKNYKTTLTEIYAENNRLTDFSFINGATNLHILMLGGNATTMVQTNLNTWLNSLTKLEVLTLSDIQLADLSFLSSMESLVRLDIANCGIHAFHGDVSNIDLIADRYSTLKVLNISDNDLSDDENEVLTLRNVTLLTVLYADNICNHLDAYTLTYSMTELRYVSLENCGVTTMSWLSKYNNLVYVDLAGNPIADVDLDIHLSNASIKTLKELYLDTTADNCTFGNAYRLTDFNVKKLSLENVNVGQMEKLPYMDQLEYLNIAHTGLINLTGADPETSDLYSIVRYTALKTIVVNKLQVDISPLEDMNSLETVYAVDVPASELFHMKNLHALQRMYKKGIDCYLYDSDTEYVPTATREGIDILNLIDDISCNITVAADNQISDNNPYLVSSINDYPIVWAISNTVNYEIADGRITVKDYTNIDDEALTITATITVYPDQAPVSRSFIVNTHILRAADQYLDIDATGLGTNMHRSDTFTYVITVQAAITDGFASPVKPVVNNIKYRYDTVNVNDTTVPYTGVFTVGTNGQYFINSDAFLNSTTTITAVVGHNDSTGTFVSDVTKTVSFHIAERTFRLTLISNGGTVKDANGNQITYIDLVEDTPIFASISFSRTGYLFNGWFTNSACTELFWNQGNIDIPMPAANTTIYAKWTAHSYTLYFNANGGSVSEACRTVLCDTAIGSMPTPTRTGYVFNGWYTAANGGTKVTANTSYATANDVTVYAHWSPASYTVTFNANGGTVGTTSKQVTYTSTYGSLPTPSRDCYTFLGWYTAASGGSQVTSSTAFNSTGNVTLYAHWELNPEKGWILRTNLPANAVVTQTKFTYTLTSYTSSASSSLSGWTHYDTARTSWGATQGPVYSNPANGVRNVWSEQYVSGYNTYTVWHYYRYTTSSGSGGSWTSWGNYTVYDQIDLTAPLTETTTWSGYSGTVYKYWYNGTNYRGYVGEWTTQETDYNSPIYGTRWYYQEPVYTYYFKKTEEKTSPTYPSGSNISNVQEWVMYRMK